MNFPPLCTYVIVNITNSVVHQDHKQVPTRCCQQLESVAKVRNASRTLKYTAYL